MNAATATTTPEAILAQAKVTYRPGILHAIADTLMFLFYTKAWIERLTPEEREAMGIDLP
jgi:hypothetical protein